MRKSDGKKANNAELTALRLLSLRDHSRGELRKKLIAKGCAMEAVTETLTKLERLGLLNDPRYAQQLAGSLSRAKYLGTSGILQVLSQKGIPAATAREAAENAEVVFPLRDRLRQLVKLKLRGRVLEKMSPREKGRLAGFLRRRGYPWDEIAEVFRETGGVFEE